MKLKSADTELILTDRELATIQEVIDTLRKCQMGFTVIDSETIAGFDKDDYDLMIKCLDAIFRRARRER